MTTETSLSELEVLEPRARLLRDLRTTPHGLSAPEAEPQLVQSGRERVAPPQRLAWPGELARQLTHPLALLRWLAARLWIVVGSNTVGIAGVLVILLNAAFAFVQELSGRPSGRGTEAVHAPARNGDAEAHHA